MRHLSALCILIVLHVIMVPWGFLLLDMIRVGAEFVFFLYLAFKITWFGFMLGILFEYQFRKQPVFFRALMNCLFYLALCFLHDLHRFPALIDEDAAFGAAAQGFDPKLSGAGEEIQHPPALDIELDDIEERLLHVIRGGANIVVFRGLQFSAPGRTGDDTHRNHPFRNKTRLRRMEE